MFENYFPDLTKKEEKYCEKIQHKIHYCTYCQPYDGGEYVWILGREYCLYDLFDEFDVPKKSRENIAHYLSCPNCGHSNFEEYEIIGLEDDFDNETRLRLEMLSKKYAKEIDELSIYIKLYPSLALKNKFARRIAREFSEKKLKSTNIDGKWYRARVVSESKIYGFDDLHVPQIGIPNEGRYNYAGQNFLYLARDERTAITEVLKSDQPALVWVQEYENVKIDNVLDLRSDWDDLGINESDIITALLAFGILEQKVDENKRNYKPEYYITKFISDLARNEGYTGIIYNSTIAYSENVVIFDLKNATIDCILKPRIKIFESITEFEF